MTTLKDKVSIDNKINKKECLGNLPQYLNPIHLQPPK